jgi:hypothetical protein
MSVAVGISRHGFGDAAAALLHTATHETNTAAVSVLVNLRIGSSLLWTKAARDATTSEYTVRLR